MGLELHLVIELARHLEQMLEALMELYSAGSSVARLGMMKVVNSELQLVTQLARHSEYMLEFLMELHSVSSLRML